MIVRIIQQSSKPKEFYPTFSLHPIIWVLWVSTKYTSQEPYRLSYFWTLTPFLELDTKETQYSVFIVEWNSNVQQFTPVDSL